MKLFAAPLQGYTDVAYRHFHARIYGGADAYFSPFVRIERGEPRQRDIRDITSPLNDSTEMIPQVIFRDTDEFITLVDAVIQAGYRAVDLNMGCPFAPQLHRGRGAAVIANHTLLAALADIMRRYQDIRFSAKMRLGVTAPDEWRSAADLINAMPLTHVTLHPRTAQQQYSGTLHYDQIQLFSDIISHPMVLNGDIHTPQQIAVADGLYGIMAGRGLLARPSLFMEYRTGVEISRPDRISLLLRLHDAIYTHYAGTLCGDSQLLSKIKPFWDYLEPEIGHKTFKAISKSKSAAAYRAVINTIQ